MVMGNVNLSLKAEERVYTNMDGIDFNVGCPEKFSVLGRMGAALMKDLY